MADDKVKFKAILFDLDPDQSGLDTLQDIADSANGALEQLGFASHPTEAYKYFVGNGIEEAIRRILPESRRDAKTIARCLELNRTEYSRRWLMHTRLYNGIAEMLGELHKRNVPMAVLFRTSRTSLLIGWSKRLSAITTSK
jgi:phosphoglycolate phosphatase